MSDPTALWVVPVSDIGGVARHTLDAVGAGIPGWRTTVLCPEGPLADILRERGQPVLTGAFGPAAGLSASLSTLRHTVDALRPTVVHTHLAYADIVAAMVLGPTLARRGGRPRLISTEHGIAPDDSVYHGTSTKSAVMARVHQARTLAFDELIAVCESTRDVMLAKWHPHAPITVVLNGVDRPQPAPTPQPGLRIASISRLAPEKGLDRLLDAFAALVTENPATRLTIAGQGPLDADLRAQAARLGIAQQVDFPGFANATELLARSDVVVQLSVWENCSYTLLDACAAGLGVVATPVGGNPEIIGPDHLARSTDTARIARLVMRQALDVSARPGLPVSWPTVSTMTSRIAAAYEGDA